MARLHHCLPDRTWYLWFLGAREVQSTFGTRLRKAYAEFRGWKSRNKIRSSQPRFTAARVHRNRRPEFPSMSSKAIAGKTLSFWLAEVACKEAAKPSATN